MSSWMQLNGRRLDCNPYLSGAFEARVRLEKLRVKKLPLDSLTTKIFNGPRFARNYVEDPRHGVPFLGSVDILLADLSHLSYISKNQVRANPDLLIEEGWTLITCSGTIGRMAYARTEMNGMAGSQHFMRVVPDRDKISPGYLYAYLSSKFGVPIVLAGTYGAIIQHIEPHHITNIPVPRFDEQFETSIHELINKATLLRTESKRNLEQGETYLVEALGEPPEVHNQDMQGFTTKSKDLFPARRLGAFQYNPKASSLDNWVVSHSNGYATLEELTEDVFEVPMFKHVYVDADNGTPFFTSGDLFNLDRKPQKFLSPKTKDLDKYIIKQGWILVARHGQLGGIIGRPQYSDSMLHNTATSDLVLRVIPNSKLTTAGFLYCFFASKKYGYSLIVRHATGNSIPFINPSYLKTMYVPLVDMETQKALNDLVVSAFEKRNQATLLEDEARRMVEQAIEQN
jgi:type I restriction enzyme S subunit